MAPESFKYGADVARAGTDDTLPVVMVVEPSCNAEQMRELLKGIPVPTYLCTLPFETAPQVQPHALVAEIMCNAWFTCPATEPESSTRVCGACGSRGKCMEPNGHKGKHVALSGFRWF